MTAKSNIMTVSDLCMDFQRKYVKDNVDIKVKLNDQQLNLFHHISELGCQIFSFTLDVSGVDVKEMLKEYENWHDSQITCI